MKKNKLQEKGQALVIIALAALVLFGFAALAIDGSRVFSDRRNAQNAADTASMAAALARIRTSQGQSTLLYTTAALNRAASNGYSNDADSTVVVNLCSDAGVTCIGLPAGADASEYIKVQITSIVPMTFAKVIGKKTITNTVDAIARANINPPVSDWLNSALVAVKGDNSDSCFKNTGNPTINIHGSGVFVNCTGNSALFLNGSVDISMDGDAEVAGCANSPNFDVSPGAITCHVPPQTIDASTFANVPTTLSAPVCANAGSIVGGVPGPGYYNSIVTISSAVTLAPGTYCFNAGVQISGGGSLSGTGPGPVQLVMGNNDLSFGGSGNSFVNLEVYAQNGSLNVPGSGVLTANRLRFFSTGTGNFSTGNHANVTSSNAYLYFESGNFNTQAQATVNLQAPPSGDTFAGYLIHYPWSNTNAMSLNGGTGCVFTGTILAPHSDITFNGGSGFELHGQVISYTIKIAGNNASDIYYQGPGNTTVTDPTIEFTR